MAPADSKVSSLVVLPAGTAVAPAVLAESASACGVDPYRVRLLLKGNALAVIGRGPNALVEPATRALCSAGVPSAMLSPDDLSAVPRAATAGGLGADAGGGVALLVHGKPAGPPAGAPLLLVFGDVGVPPESPSTLSSRPPDTFSQSVLRSDCAVVDVVWGGGRIRVPWRTMTWKGLTGRTFSGPGNLLTLLTLLAKRAAGTVLDTGFAGQELPLGPLLTTPDVPAGADPARTALFERYVLAAAALWRKGLYPRAGPGQIVLPGKASPESAREFFSRRASPRSPVAIPWIRRGTKSRVRPPLWPWLIGMPFLGSVLDSRGGAASAFLPLALAIGGAGGLLTGLAALRRRERMRSVPQSRIRSMALGPVQVVGRVAAALPLTAPYSRIRCGWYRLELRTRTDGGEGQRSLFDSDSKGGSGDMPFWLTDESAAVLVQPSGAEVDIEPQRTAVDEGTEAVEWVLADGETVFVAGFAQRRSTDSTRASAPSGTGVPERDDVFIGSAPDEPFVIAEHSRRSETSEQTRQFLFGALVGGLYLLAALLLWMERLAS